MFSVSLLASGYSETQSRLSLEVENRLIELVDFDLLRNVRHLPTLKLVRESECAIFTPDFTLIFSPKVSGLEITSLLEIELILRLIFTLELLTLSGLGYFSLSAHLLEEAISSGLQLEVDALQAEGEVLVAEADSRADGSSTTVSWLLPLPNLASSLVPALGLSPCTGAMSVNLPSSHSLTTL